MRELLLVLEREFTTRVRSRSFLISTALVPLLMLVAFLAPVLAERVARGGEANEARILIVDEGPPGIADRALAAIRAETPRQGSTSLRVALLQRPLAAVRDSLDAALQARILDGYLWIPKAVVDQGEVAYRARNTADNAVQQRLTGAVSNAVQAARLADAGLEAVDVASLLRPVRIQVSRLATDEGMRGRRRNSTGLAFAAGMFLYMMILMNGVQVMQSVQEEKANRISEVLVSSVRASRLMLGKVFGVGGVAVLQVLIWIASAALIVTAGAPLFPELRTAMPALLSAVNSEVGLLAATPFALFALLGFTLFATLFAAAGAAAASTEDAQRFTLPLIMPLLLPVFLQQSIAGNPHGSIATTLGWFPLTSPIVMPMRMAAGDIPAFEILGWAAGKIYRIGILSTGKRPSFRELARWVRTA
jgi:ABC-2 type transport system permease protein